MSQPYKFTAERVVYDTTFEAEVAEGLWFMVGACIDHGDNVNRCDLVEIKLPSGEFQVLGEPISWMDDDLCDRAVEQHQEASADWAAEDRLDRRRSWEGGL